MIIGHLDPSGKVGLKAEGEQTRCQKGPTGFLGGLMGKASLGL